MTGREKELLDALRALLTNEHVSLGDLVYTVREREGKGWDGPSITAWNDAVVNAERLVRECTAPDPTPPEFPRHPMQPLHIDGWNTIRFRANRIVRWLCSTGKLDLNETAIKSTEQGFEADDHMQIAQLLGYSVDGYADLSYVTDESIKEAFAEAEKLCTERKGT